MVVTGALRPMPHHGAPRTIGKGIRMLTLSRSMGETYGFHLKGGKEHRTGFFISHVEDGSVAQKCGIKAGDQLLEVGGRSVAGAEHRQVADTIAATSTVSLLLRAVGVIPVKEHEGDPLTWVMVDDVPPDRRPAGGAADGRDGGRRYRIVIPAVGRSSLGFSITHDPLVRNGTFVATVKRGGPASGAGLRRNDQILACNGRDLATMDHNQVVIEMKKQSQIVLEVRRLPEVLAGESSGYNSSASSTTGDQTPPLLGGGRRQVLRRLPGTAGLQEHVMSRLSAVSHRLEEREQELRTIDSEWADAEAQQKRQHLSTMTCRLEAAKQNGARKGHLMSRSESDLLDATQYDPNDQSLYFTSAINPNATGVNASMIRSSHSTTNLLNYQDCNRNRTINNSNGGGGASRQSHSTADLSYQDNNRTRANANNNSCTSDEENLASSTAYSTSLRSTQSSDEYASVASHKIALLTNSDPHVNNIVVSPARFRDEKDALCRLELLSSPSEQSSTVSGTSVNGDSLVSRGASLEGSLVTRLGRMQQGQQQGQQQQEQEQQGQQGQQGQLEQVQQMEMQLQRIQEQKRLLAEQEQQLFREKSRFEEQRRGSVQRTLSAPVAPQGALVITCVGNTSDHTADNSNFSNCHSPLQRHFSRSPSPNSLPRSPPSPTPSSASGRHTSRILIKSNPPAPPKRHTTTTLTRQHHRSDSYCSCCYACHQTKHASLVRHKGCHECGPHQYNCRRSPPSSPSSSSGVSCGSNTHQNSLPRRCKSFDELSHSSNEDTAIWDDVRQYHTTIDQQNHPYNNKGNIPPAPLPKPHTKLLKTPNSTSRNMADSDNPPPPPPPPLASDNYRTNLASALMVALQQRNTESVSSDTNNDMEKAQAYQAKIDAYKKEKSSAPKDVLKVQHEKLMEEFKQKHRRMFTAEEAANCGPPLAASEESSVVKSAPVRNVDSFTIPKSQLENIKLGSPQISTLTRVQSSVIPNNASLKKKPLEMTKSENGPVKTLPFESKIIMRSMSSNLKTPPEKRHTVHLSRVNEDESGETGSALQYWKNKDKTENKSVSTSKLNSKPTLTSAMSFTSSASFTSSLSENSQPIEDVDEVSVVTSTEPIPEKVETRSASELIKTFNKSNPSTMQNKDKVSNVYLNKVKSTKGKAPQPVKSTLSTALVTNAKPAHQGGISSSTSRGHPVLVKTQVSPQPSIIPPPPPLPTSSNDLTTSETNQPSPAPALTSQSVSTLSFSTSSPEEKHYSQISISVNNQPVIPSSPYSSSSAYTHQFSDNVGTKANTSLPSSQSSQRAAQRQSVPIQIVNAPTVEYSLLNLSPSDFIIPRPPSPLMFSSSTEIPMGVPPPPPRDSWNERSGGSSSNVVQLSHSQAGDDGQVDDFKNRFSDLDNSASNYKAIFNCPLSAKPLKPLVMIDSYASSSDRPTPQKMEFVAKGSYRRVESQENGDSGKVLQSDLTSSLNRSKLRQRRNPDDRSLNSDSDPEL